MARLGVDDGGPSGAPQPKWTMDAHAAAVLFDRDGLDPAPRELPVVLELREEREDHLGRRRDDARRLDLHRPLKAGVRFSTKADVASAKSSVDTSRACASISRSSVSSSAGFAARS